MEDSEAEADKLITEAVLSALTNPMTNEELTYSLKILRGVIESQQEVIESLHNRVSAVATVLRVIIDNSAKYNVSDVDSKPNRKGMN
jgi:hypothetical protein